MSDTVFKVIDNFLEDKSLRYRYDLNVVKRLLGKTHNDSDNQRREYALLSQKIIQRVENKEIVHPDVQEAIAVAIKESVLSYTRDKKTAVDIYKEFVSFIKKVYQVEIPVTFPPTFASEFNRQMYMLKVLHEQSRGTAYLKDKLWVSERTIENDLAKLRNSGVTIMDQKLSISGVERQDGVIEFSSTVHPIFLALNLAQVLVMLLGLQHMAKDETYKKYAVKLAATIWHELSDYAKETIEQLSGPLSLDSSWYKEIKQYGSRGLFNTEEECSTDEGAGNVVYFLKNRKECVIEYRDEKGNVTLLTNCLIKDYCKETKEITVGIKDEEYIINSATLIRVIGKDEYI